MASSRMLEAVDVSSTTAEYGSLFLAALGLGTIAYLYRDSLSCSLRPLVNNDAGRRAPKQDLANSRCIVHRMQLQRANCVVFFGSQSGNAQDMATKIAREAQSRYGLTVLVADLDDYDYDGLHAWPADALAVFVLASYGDGEPTDNAQRFFDFMAVEQQSPFDGDAPLRSMRYAALGLGNTNYVNFNAVMVKVHNALGDMGARCFGPVGALDDAKGDMEEDFLSWKEEMWSSIADEMGLVQKQTAPETSCKVSELPSFSGQSHNGQHGAQGQHVPVLASFTKAYSLSTGDRACLHMELDLSPTSLRYETGDHLGIIPPNADQEVDRFLRVFGLTEKRHAVIEIAPASGSQAPVPSPTTYDAALRYYLEINAPVSRQHVCILAGFVSDERKRNTLANLGKDKQAFAQATQDQYYNLASFIENLFPEDPILAVPFATLVDGIPKLRHRFYSISSSPLVDPAKLSITTVVESVAIPNTNRTFSGVATSYLLNVARSLGEGKTDCANLTPLVSHHTPGPATWVYVRKSSFRLADDISPILMIGPGTGVAPFRAFVQERSALAEAGKPVGNMTLVFGCRRDPDDFLYKKEWKAYKQALGDQFTLLTAFSRQSNRKVYVQDVLRQQAALVSHILEHGRVYVCGDVRMAHGVQATLAEILCRCLSITPGEADRRILHMRGANRYQEDVW